MERIGSSKRKETEKMGEVAFTVTSGEIMTEPWMWGWGARRNCSEADTIYTMDTLFRFEC